MVVSGRRSWEQLDAIQADDESQRLRKDFAGGVIAGPRK
jgi:hypothetical protein